MEQVTLDYDFTARHCNVKPDTLDLVGQGANVVVQFQLGSTLAGYRFQTNTESATCGIVLLSASNPPQGPPPGEFAQWNPAPANRPTKVTCVVKNQLQTPVTWNYTVTLINLTTGATLAIDPSIRENRPL